MEASAQRAAGGDRQPALTGLLVAGSLLLALRLWLFVDEHAVNLMVMDQFDFLAPLFDGGYGALEKFRFQFWKSPHRMGAGWPIIEAVARFSGWNTRADALSIVVVMALGCGLALWLVRRLFGRFSPWDLSVPLLLLSLKQYGTFVGTPDVALGAMPVLLLIGCGLALTVDRASLRVALLLGLDLMCVYTGFALFAGLLIPVLLFWEGWSGRVKPAMAAGALAWVGVCGLSFFIGFDATPATRPVTSGLAWTAYLSYASGLFERFFEARNPLAAAAVGLVWPLVLFGPLSVAALRSSRARGADRRPLDSVVFLLLGFGALFVIFNTAGRVGVSADYAFASRYVTLMIPGMLGLYLALRGMAPGRLRSAALGVLALALGASELVGGPAAREAATQWAASKRSFKECYLESRDFERCNARSGDVVYPKAEEFERIRGRLRQLEERRLNLFLDEGAP